MDSKYIWKLKTNKQELVDSIAKTHNISIISATILVNRDIINEQDIQNFLEPSIDEFYDPYLMKDMDKAICRLLEAKEKNENITIYGDYDVDGITSTSVLYMFLEERGYSVSYYIPNRLEEGYGINNNAIDKIKEMGTSLIITVDTGITAVEQVEHAKKYGIDMIITDHHECQEELPDALAVIDPKQEECKYPFDMLAGVGVTFKLIHALAIELNCIEDIWKYLDIVAIGTIADIVPLIDENRIITKLAFKTMKNTWNLGLKALLITSGIKPKDKITAGSLGFRVAPRLNAAGRLGDAKRGIELFITDNKERAVQIAEELNEENNNRQEIERRIYKEAVEIVERDMDLNNTKILVIASKEWHHGVIGIVSSRITEKYYRPSVLLCIEDGVATGSARSVDGFSIFNALHEAKDLLNKFGGHEMAAGLSIQENKIDLLREKTNAYAKNVMKDETLVPKLNADMELSIEQVDLELIKEIQKLEPYGMGNSEPKFISRGFINNIKKIGKESNHLKIQLHSKAGKIDCIGFEMSDYYDLVDVSHSIMVLCTLSINKWNGVEKPQMMLKDIKLQETYMTSLSEYMMDFKEMTIIDSDGRIIERLNKLKISLTRKDYESIYRTLLRLEKQRKQDITIAKLLTKIGYVKPEQVYKLLIALEVFKELRLLTYVIAFHKLKYRLNKGVKVQLEQSKLYIKLSENFTV